MVLGFFKQWMEIFIWVIGNKTFITVMDFMYIMMAKDIKVN